MKKPLLTARQVARRLGVSVHSLANRRFRGSGPLFTLVGPKLIRYDEELLEQWIAARTFSENHRPERRVGKRAAPVAAPADAERELLPGISADGDADKKKAPAVAPRQGLPLSTSPAPASILEPSSVALETLPR